MPDAGIAAGRSDSISLEALRLDPRNPRLPPSMHGASETELALYIDAHYDPILIAESIARRGYFPSEPLIALEPVDGVHIVIEGNRRLVALRGLADESLRSQFVESAKWDELARIATLPERIPAIIVSDPTDAAAVVGYRHISGIEPWEPLPKARFIAALLEKPQESLSFEEVGDLVGESEQTVRSLYRNYRVLSEASERFDIDVSLVEGRFGLFARALQSAGIRSFLHVPPPGQVAVGADVLPSDAGSRLSEVLDWIYGSTSGTDPVFSDSRDLTKLGTVLSSEDGVAALRSTRDLEYAFEAAGGPRSRVLNRLAQARNAIRAAKDQIHLFRNDPQVEELIASCHEALDELN